MTYSGSHAKSISVYKKLLERLDTDSITIYIVSSPTNTETIYLGSYVLVLINWLEV